MPRLESPSPVPAAEREILRASSVDPLPRERATSASRALEQKGYLAASADVLVPFNAEFGSYLREA